MRRFPEGPRRVEPSAAGEPFAAEMMPGRVASQFTAPSSLQWWPPSLLPIALPAFHVLRFYVEAGVSPFAVLRVLILATVAGLALWMVASLVLGDTRKGTVLATLAILVFLGGGDPATIALVGVLIAAVTLLLPRLLRVRFPWLFVPGAGNALALILILTLVIRASQTGTLAQGGRDIGWAVAGARTASLGQVTAEVAPEAPDIYVLMLEDYPRADTLARLFSFDNSPFLSALEDRGFTISPKSRANYSNSLLTVLTMLQARHVEAIPELDHLRAGASEDLHPVLRDTLNSGVTLDILRRRGYEIVTAPSGFEQLALRSADRFQESGDLNDFELVVIESTALAKQNEPWFLELLGEQFRHRIRAGFGLPAELSRERSARPRFVFIHIPAPHAPIVFGRNGEAIAVTAQPYQYDLSDPGRFMRLYDAQLEYVNQLTLNTVDDIGRGAHPTLTIVMSDEGLGWFNSALDPDPEMRPLLLLANLFAARTPGGEDLFGPAITPVNIMPIVLSRYLGVDLPRQPDKGFISSDDAPFDGLEVPNTDADPSR
jgi:hypothetical protein